ncbi:hypothetical protein SLEP1_g53056 [Rubroshorea leprosula]|uniref:Uncharacterized protein n=1 Tax=Rubroshorea leprosula TaxID=152421 RepID=A0AAV5JSN8_9ROSI|nr:hypothetical protein SLEP1_g28134 [Rubroshorea leprosula]GKV46041.1 hypothetical protein SLEP1_g53056 [Rubroshorea leprosula]
MHGGTTAAVVGSSGVPPPGTYHTMKNFNFTSIPLLPNFLWDMSHGRCKFYVYVGLL